MGGVGGKSGWEEWVGGVGVRSGGGVCGGRSGWESADNCDGDKRIKGGREMLEKSFVGGGCSLMGGGRGGCTLVGGWGGGGTLVGKGCIF